MKTKSAEYYMQENHIDHLWDVREKTCFHDFVVESYDTQEAAIKACEEMQRAADTCAADKNSAR